jgi:hypothetical protein
LILTVLRIVLPAEFTPDTARGCGRAPVGAGDVGARYVDDGARNPVFGVPDLLPGVDRAPILLRVLLTGRAGSAVVGGPIEGRDGRGRAADMV